MKYFFYIVLIFFASATITFSQYNNHDFSLSGSFVYTTEAEVFLRPNSNDPAIRNRSNTLIDIMNPGIDLRYRLFESLIVGLSSEYMNKTQVGMNLSVSAGNNTIRLETEDGITLIPVELSAYYDMPFSTESFKFLMGGGVGYYYGDFQRKFGDTKITTLERQFAFGIHVSVSMEYILLERYGLRFEMKFRDPEYKIKSKYDKTIVNIDDTQITILQDTFDTKINVNGIVFLLSASYLF